MSMKMPRRYYEILEDMEDLKLLHDGRQKKHIKDNIISDLESLRQTARNNQERNRYYRTIKGVEDL